MRRIALYSDVHANTLALEAVVAAIAAEGVEERYCLGDLVGLGPRPEEAVALVRSYGDRVVQGNYDRAIGSHLRSPGSDFPTPQEALDGAEAYAFTIAEVGRASAEYLYALPRDITINEGGTRIVLCHGTPRFVSEIVASDAPAPLLVALAREAEADVVCCGHTHVPVHRSVPSEDGVVHWVNVGSVGRPRDGDPRAAWAELVLGTQEEVLGQAHADTASRRIGQSEVWLGVVFHRIPYDGDAVARDMIRHALPATLAAGIKIGLEGHDAEQAAARRAEQAAGPQASSGDAPDDEDPFTCGHTPSEHCACVLEDRIAAYESLARMYRGALAEVSPAARRLRSAIRSCRINRNVNEAAILEAFQSADIALRTSDGRAAFEAERDRLYGLESGFDPFVHVLSPEEGTYVSGDVQGHLALIEAAYAEGVFTAPEVRNGLHPPDHISSELDFVAHCLRGAAAGDPRARDRAHDFFATHLAEWAVLFAVVVGQQAREPVMRFAGLALDKFLTCEGAIFRHAVPEHCYLRTPHP
ncbi:MAG: metallophosphoesterase family protein [Coriobacteriia bacterium]|nr:metallophosphoesterase family protein [Coriobacteriia bacterium]